MIANSVVVPVMALGGMVLGLAAAALSFIWMPAANFLVHSAGAALALSNRLAGLSVRLPGAWVRIFTPNLFELALVHALLGLWLCAPIAPVRSAGLGAGVNVQTVVRAGSQWRKTVAAALLCVLAADAAWWMRERYLDPRFARDFSVRRAG